MTHRLFTSESVTEGHPDKICDQISDAILDALLTQDPRSRVAVETLVTTGLVHVAGEVTTEGYADIPGIVRSTVLGIGYDSSQKGFDGRSCGVEVSIGSQSPDIAQGVDSAYEARVEGDADPLDAQGAGDQGLMFGYACDDTPELMPLPIWLAHRLAQRLSEVRKSGEVPYLRPDGKTQVTIAYDGDRAVALDTVVVSTQHAADVSLENLLQPDIADHVVKPVVDGIGIDTDNFRLLVNPTGRFEVGGPMGDAGLTGRKIIVDTYGGMARHGGGAFSGKDPSKVDRSAAYAMRWVAKNVVAAGLARRCEVQVAYAIGKAHPVGLYVETFGTESVPARAHPDRDPRGLRPAARRDHPRPRPAPADLRQDLGVRALRPRAARVHLGAHGPRRRAAFRRRLTQPTSLGAAVEGPPEQLELLRAAARGRRPRPAPGLAPVLPVARVAVDVQPAHLDRPFDYAVPADLDEQAAPGVRVRVRFAGQDVDGFVLERAEASDHPGRLTPLRRVVSPEPVLTPAVLTLCRAVADRYAGTLRRRAPPGRASAPRPDGEGGPTGGSARRVPPENLR